MSASVGCNGSARAPQDARSPAPSIVTPRHPVPNGAVLEQNRQLSPNSASRIIKGFEGGQEEKDAGAAGRRSAKQCRKASRIVGASDAAPPGAPALGRGRPPTVAASPHPPRPTPAPALRAATSGAPTAVSERIPRNISSLDPAGRWRCRRAGPVGRRASPRVALDAAPRGAAARLAAPIHAIVRIRPEEAVLLDRVLVNGFFQPRQLTSRPSGIVR